jgi:hypothetical protein
MLRIKILNKNHHPFANKIKVYGISIEAILISSFILIVLFLAAVRLNQKNKKKDTIHHGTTTR